LNTRSFLILCLLILTFGISHAQRATIKGVLYDTEGQAVENAVVHVLDHNLQTITDDYGRFTLAVPENTDLNILIQHISHRDTVIALRLKSRETRNLSITLQTVGNRLQQVNIRGKSEAGYIQVNPKLSFQMPTPGGGMESLIKMMPGISSTNELSTQYNVRGGNYDENLIFVNDIQIYRPFLVRSAQQEGMSFINPDLTGNVIFSAGGFEAKYGDKMSSVLDVQYKTPTQYGGSVSASMLGATAHAEGKVDSTFSFLVGLRFHSNAYLLKSLETHGDFKPRFFDTQMLLNWDISKKFSISLLGNFSINSYLYQPEDRTTTWGSIENMKRVTVYYDGQELDRYENYLGGLTFHYRPNDKNHLRLILSSYFAKESERYDIQSQYFLSDIEADLGNEDGEIAQEVSIRAYGTYLEHARNAITSVVSAANLLGEHKLPHSNLLSWGVKAQNEYINDHIKEWTMRDSSGYTLPMMHNTPGVSVPLDDPSRILAFGEHDYLKCNNLLNTVRFTGFVQDVWKIDDDTLPHYILNAGVRFHYWTLNKKEFTASPRLSFTYDPHWKHDWRFIVKTGLYYQPAFYREMRRPDGSLNRDIRSQRSVHVVAGTEYNFLIWRRPFKFTAEAYYKYMDHLISYTVDNVRIIYSGENDAKGYAAGLDLKISGEFVRGLESWFSVSLMKTAEDIIGDYYIDQDGNRVEPGYIPRPTDQRVAFNLFFQDHIPGYPQFRVHLNFVFASGLPYGAPNAPAYMRVLRDTWFRRVDLGCSFMFLEQSRDRMRNKSKFVRSIKNAGVYIEVFNLLGTSNISSHFWVTDISGSQFAVPNYLTGRLINVKFSIEF
jgi:hypothetical protein